MFQQQNFEQALTSLGAQWTGNLPAARFIVDDSREVGAGDYFVLRDGTTVMTPSRAQQLADQAVQQGAVAVISHIDVALPKNVTLIRLANTRDHLLALAQAFYGPIPASLKLIAVTGTNGKTTTTYLIESIAKQMGLKAGVLGTISHRYPGYCEVSENTTPGTLKLYKLLNGMVEAHCDLVAMEVSSHAIVQNRIAGLMFDVAVWNNLGVDHLDYHKTREAYGEAKQQLFKKHLALSFAAGKQPCAIANATDMDVMRFIQTADPTNWGGKVMTFSADPAISGDVQLDCAAWRGQAWQGQLKVGTGVWAAALPLVGRYNLANAAGACAALIALGFDAARVSDALARVDQVPGRMQVVRDHAPRVIVDFAHTPEALQNALIATRETMTEGQLTVVFGCGGDRDPSKRPMMAKYAQDNADNVVVTSDNPRTEDPLAIIQDVVAGLDMAKNVVVEPDRRVAIAKALDATRDCAHDVVVIAGKGHEDYQILGTTKTHFSDVEEVQKFFGV